MGYQDYGIPESLVERVKKKLQNDVYSERVSKVLEGVTKKDLQSRSKVKALLQKVSKVLGIKIDTKMSNNIVKFVIDQKIDPKNTFHLIKLWGMFR
ncbi:stage VI sporulation protein F [Chengkuizengella axinellae]|uniref:Stage VI sporulation protein F n=1 Tax=Chengkuizengella axinellae TaxID=3064388 RepID=A0ABT9IVK6_9BACL|nr:stage VI sporulation protein F [Chengkuizengella sp. 2205SS18-9]MDP5273381.1 stage VI sporulation protein F [Chengkuizengella sp. 2205SS18-9]